MLRSSLRALIALVTILAMVGAVPLHLAEEHHGPSAVSHEGPGHEHDADDHLVISTGTALHAPLPSLQPAYTHPFLIALDLDAAVRSVCIARYAERLHDPPDPDQAALPPTPPRAPPTLRA